MGMSQVCLEQVPMIETAQLRGRLTLTELDVRTGQVLSTEHCNLTLLIGKRLAFDLLFGQHAHYVLALAAGDNASAPSLSDVGLFNEVLRGPLTSVLVDDDGVNGTCTARFYMGTTMGNGTTFREAGLFTSTVKGVGTDLCYARVTHADKIKVDTKVLIYQWDLTNT